MLNKFENAALFLRLRLPSTLIRHKNGAFRKCASSRKNLKTPALRFRVNRKHFKSRFFSRVPHHKTKITGPSAYFQRKTFDAFSKRKVRFHIPPESRGQGLSEIGECCGNAIKKPRLLCTSVHYDYNTEGSLIPFTAIIMLRLKLRDQSLFN